MNTLNLSLQMKRKTRHNRQFLGADRSGEFELCSVKSRDHRTSDSWLQVQGVLFAILLLRLRIRHSFGEDQRKNSQQKLDCANGGFERQINERQREQRTGEQLREDAVEAFLAAVCAFQLIQRAATDLGLERWFIEAVTRKRSLRLATARD